MGREDHGAIIGAFVQFFDKDGAFVAQAVNDEFVVHDLVADIDGRAPFFDRQFDDLDGAVHACAKPTRGGKIKGEGRLVIGSPAGIKL